MRVNVREENICVHSTVNIIMFLIRENAKVGGGYVKAPAFIL
jgi:hypothetical protein